MKKFLATLALLSIGILWFTYAHPWDDLTDMNGCHHCWTNCDKRWEVYWEVHCHKTISSYAIYAPAGSCPDEKEKMDGIQNKIDAYNIEITRIANETKQKYSWTQINEDILSAIIAEATEEWSIKQTYEVIKSNTAFSIYNICLNSAWLKAYLTSLKQEQASKIESAASTDEQMCQKAYGINATSPSHLKCSCKDWYKWNDKQTSCIANNSEAILTAKLQFAISWLYINWLTTYGTVAEFMPDDYLTREQASKFFVLFAKKILKKSVDTKKSVSLSDLTKADKTLQSHIKEANQLWLFNGVKWKFLPFNKLTRAQTLAVIIRSVNWKQDETWTKWYDKYYNIANNYWILEWLSFDYTTLDSINIKRSEVAMLLYRLVDKGIVK